MDQIVKFSRLQQLGLLKRGLQRRLDGGIEFINKQKEAIKEIEDTRKKYADRLEKYKDDEVVVNLLKAQLTEFDRRYMGTKQNYKNSIEEVESSRPTVRELLEYIDYVEKEKISDGPIYMFLELFGKEFLQDWYELEESQKAKNGKH